jgi:hypothetical protein
MANAKWKSGNQKKFFSIVLIDLYAIRRMPRTYDHQSLFGFVIIHGNVVTTIVIAFHNNTDEKADMFIRLGGIQKILKNINKRPVFADISGI